MTPDGIAHLLVSEMGGDNGCTFVPTEQQLAALAAGVQRMQTAGCAFTEHQVSELVAGEVSDVREAFIQYDGFLETNETLNEIFDGDIKEEM